MSLNNFTNIDAYHSFRTNLNEKKLYKNEYEIAPKNSTRNIIKEQKYKELKFYFKEAYLTDVEDNIPKSNKLLIKIKLECDLNKADQFSVTTASNTIGPFCNRKEKDTNYLSYNLNLLVKYLEQNTPETNKFLFDNLLKLSSLDKQRREQIDDNYVSSIQSKECNYEITTMKNNNLKNSKEDLLNNKTVRRKSNLNSKVIECIHKDAPHYAKVILFL